MECKTCGAKTYVRDICNSCMYDEDNPQTCTGYWGEVEAEEVADEESILADALEFAEELTPANEDKIVEWF